MAVDMFLKIDTIPGESTDDKHKDWIEVLSVSFGATQTGTGAVGGAAGRTEFFDVFAKLPVSQASPMLLKAAATGEHLKSATFVFTMNVGGTKVEYMKISLTDARVGSFKSTEDRTDVFVPAVQSPPPTQAQALFTLIEPAPTQRTIIAMPANDIPLEEVSFSFSKIDVSYQRLSDDGTPMGKPLMFAFDVQRNKLL